MSRFPLLTSILIVNGALAIGEVAPSFQNQRQTSGVVGVTGGQTARLSVLYPTAPAPILQVLCAATLVIADDQGKVLKSMDVSQLVAGRSVSCRSERRYGSGRRRPHGSSRVQHRTQWLSSFGDARDHRQRHAEKHCWSWGVEPHTQWHMQWPRPHQRPRFHNSAQSFLNLLPGCRKCLLRFD